MHNGEIIKILKEGVFACLSEDDQKLLKLYLHQSTEIKFHISVCYPSYFPLSKRVIYVISYVLKLVVSKKYIYQLFKKLMMINQLLSVNTLRNFL